MTGKVIKVEVEEISQPDADAQLIAENITSQLDAPYFTQSGHEKGCDAGDARWCARGSN